MSKKRVAVQSNRPIFNASISPSSMHIYARPEGGFNHSTKHRLNTVNLEDNDHAGIISRKAAKKIELALTWLLYCSVPKTVTCNATNKKFSFRINFITLTLPAEQVHSDQVIKDVALNSFLDLIRKTHDVVNYIWRAEAQANGNIHFHLVTDKYIHYNYIRNSWNNCIEKLGYVSAFEFKFKHRNPNSTDIHSVKHVKKLTAYLSKYFSKQRSFPCIGELRKIKGELVEILYGSDRYRAEEANKKKGEVVGHVLGAKIRPIEGRLWFCSRSLSKKKRLIISEHDYCFQSLSDVIMNAELRCYRGEFVSSYYGKIATALYEYGHDIFCELDKIKTAKEN